MRPFALAPGHAHERTPAHEHARPLALAPGHTPAVLARHPGWNTAGQYAHAIHAHLLTRTDSAAGTARAIGASDRTARRTLPRLEAVGLVELRGGRWSAHPATLDQLEALEAGTDEGAA